MMSRMWTYCNVALLYTKVGTVGFALGVAGLTRRRTSVFLMVIVVMSSFKGVLRLMLSIVVRLAVCSLGAALARLFSVMHTLRLSSRRVY